MKRLFLFSMILMAALAARSQDLLCSWHFDTLKAAPNTELVIPADSGAQDNIAAIYADGTNGSSAWICAASNTEINSFSGSTLNDDRTTPLASSAIALINFAANGKGIVLKFSTTGYENPIISYAARGTGTGFNEHYLEYSTDGITFTRFDTTAANTSSTWLTETIDLSSYNILDEAANVYIKVIFVGASTSSGNNRLDNFSITATSTSATDIIPPTVISATTTSLSDIWVRFSEPVGASAEVTANYTGVGAITSATRTTGLDSVHIVLTTPLTFGIPDTIIVNNVEDIAGNPMAAAQSFPVQFGVLDVTPPTAISAWPETHAVVKVKFSEAMDDVTAETVANYTGLAGISSATLNATMDTVTLALSTNLINAVADTLYVQDVEDIAGNAMAAPQMFVLMLDTVTIPKALVITEIMYNPAESGTDSTEFIEIYNNDVVTVDLMNYVLTYGASTFTFPSLVVNPGEYALVSSNAAAASNFYGVTFLQGSTGGIGNGGATVVLRSPSGLLVDTLTYDDAAPWPTLADEGGYSLSLCDPDLDNSDGSNWSLGTVFFGTVNSLDVYADPGQGCVTPSDTVPPVALHALLTNLSTAVVTFNETLDLTSAQTTSHYTGLGVVSSAVLTNDTVVTLTLSAPLQNAQTYVLEVTGISDLESNVMSLTYQFPLMLDTTTSIDDYNQADIQLYPNPANDAITVKGVASADLIEVYNNMGMLVLSRKAEGNDIIIIETSTLANGSYYINIRMKDGAVETRPVVIIK